MNYSDNGRAAASSSPAQAAPPPALAPNGAANSVASPPHSVHDTAPSARLSPRLVGVDAARGLAVLGMFVVHVGLGWTLADGSNALYPITAGRAAGLFAVLAGVSIALLSGGPQPPSGSAWGVALWRVVLRGLLVLPIGVALTLLDTPVSVILSYYAVFFVLAVPLLQERWKVVAGAALVLAVVGPLASFYLRGMIDDGAALASVVDTVNGVDPLQVFTGEGVVDFLLTGAYPAITWLPFVLAGLAVGRLDLHRPRVQVGLVAVGVAVAVTAYGVSALALWAVGGTGRLVGSTNPATGQAYTESGVADALHTGFPGLGLPTSEGAWLLVAAPHSGTPFEVLGVIGVALAVLGLCLLVTPYMSWVLYPITAVGALALTVYVAHVLVIHVADTGALDGTPLGVISDHLAVSILVGALLLASLWRGVLRRGPLEWLLHVVSSWGARRIP
ncbi:DUF418 domain-containing protein [Lipingzhangella rawalii]|uniref:DUF418 domain-containing protein n=1 Tax=Lipingzhangella rawalii TaxID=2055835 RepID=UPI00287B8A71|nr:DUF418 domain-containing protein [Lipingzhangella rawalii]